MSTSKFCAILPYTVFYVKDKRGGKYKNFINIFCWEVIKNILEKKIDKANRIMGLIEPG